MLRLRFFHKALTALSFFTLVPLHTAAAEVMCIQAVNKVVKGKVVTQLKKVKRATKCKTGEVREAVDMSVYGDGSAGAKTFGTETLSDMNAMYTNVTVTGTLTVPSGTVIRCTGTFVNNGTINVSFGTDSSNTVTPAHPGISLAPAGIGGEGTTSSDIVGGKGGIGLPESSAALLRYPGAAAGGASGGSSGRRGGGALTILCKNGITNAGTINADGQQPPSGGVFSVFPAVGGGGGGVVILASATSIILTSGSTVSAAGGAGSAPVNPVGFVTMTSGGGGGGGIVHLLAPSITTTGANINVSGGAGGAAGGLSNPPTSRQSGPGGGASGGNGGNGATFDNGTPNSSPAGSPGSNGHIITSVLDPTPLF